MTSIQQLPECAEIVEAVRASRAAAQAQPEPAEQLLTNSERWELCLDWGPVELNQFASHVLTQHPLVFDAAAAYVGQCFGRSAAKVEQNGGAR